MGSIKRFFIEHGEKVVFGFVAFLCLWSFLSMITVSASRLALPDGKTYVVEPAEIEGWMRAIKTRMGSDRQYREMPPVDDVPGILRQQKMRGDLDVTPLDASWLAYQQPPKPAPWVWRSIGGTGSTAPGGKAMPPYQYLTRIEAPTDWSVHVGPAGILIMCRGSSAITQPLEDEVNTALFIKRIGEGKDDLTKSIREEFLGRSTDGSVLGESDRSESSFGETGMEDGGFGDLGNFGGLGETEEEQPREDFFMERGEEGTSEMESVYPWAAPESAPKSLSELQARLQKQEATAAANERLLVDPSTTIPTRWKVLTPQMKAYRYKPNPAAILRSGKLPDPAAMPRSIEGSDTEGRDDAGQSPFFFGAGRPDSRGVGAGELGGNRDGEGAVGETGSVLPPVKPHEPRWYVWLQKDVEENTLYRYRMVSYCKAKDLPSELRMEPKYRWYTPYVEMGGMGGRFFGITTEAFGKFIESEQPVSGGIATFVQPMPLETDANGLVQGLRDPQSTLRTPLAEAYLKGNAYSIFTYTDVILTPLKRRISLVSASGFSEEQYRYERVSIKVEAIKDEELTDEGETTSTRTGTRTRPRPRSRPTPRRRDFDDDGMGGDEFEEQDDYRPSADVEEVDLADIVKSQSRTYTLSPIPPVVEKVSPRSFLVVKDGKAVYGENQKPKLKSLAEVYNPVLRGGSPPEIGQDGERVAGELWDFATGWGLVDVRRANVIITFYKDAARTEFHNRTETKKAYLVIRELNPPKGRAPRYKRVLHRLPVREDDTYSIEIEWEPSLVEKAVATRRQRLLLGSKQIKDWSDFAEKLVAAGEETTPSPGRRIWGLLQEETRAVLRDGATLELTESLQETVTEQINERILSNRYLYSAYGSQIFPDPVEKVRPLLKRDPRSLSDVEVMLRNRLLLEGAFPELVVPAGD